MYYLIGEKLSHSYSKEIHNGQGFGYELKELKSEELDEFLKNKDFDGLNVTIPYKKTVLPYVVQSDFVKSVGAVNTVVNRNGTLYGFNTDVIGLIKALDEKGIDVSGKKVLILGSGGASRAALKAVEILKGESVVISRRGENNYDNLYLHYDADIIINTTPVGMSPNILGRPVDLAYFKNLKGVMDLIYNPDKTQLIMQAEKLGIKWQNGLSMLIWQALASEELFCGNATDESDIVLHKRPDLFLKNIVLIGMPFSGKSAVGLELSLLTGFEFIDTDLLIEARGESIRDIFLRGGETEFRKIEKEVILKVSSLSKKIIATGGGAVLDGENVDRLKQNGVLVLLERNVLPEELEGRPLAKSVEEYNALKSEREKIYNAAKDYTVDNDSDVTSVAEKILKKVGVYENFSS